METRVTLIHGASWPGVQRTQLAVFAGGMMCGEGNLRISDRLVRASLQRGAELGRLVSRLRMCYILLGKLLTFKDKKRLAMSRFGEKTWLFTASSRTTSRASAMTGRDWELA